MPSIFHSCIDQFPEYSSYFSILVFSHHFLRRTKYVFKLLFFFNDFITTFRKEYSISYERRMAIWFLNQNITPLRRAHSVQDASSILLTHVIHVAHAQTYRIRAG